MTKWVRWWGLGVFLVFVALFAVLWIFFVDGFVKSLIEEQGTNAVGAKVELDDADLSLLPAGLELTRLQVTNPEKPMTNAVDIARISMGLDGLNLLRRKIIIEEMAVEGVQFGTARAYSGTVRDQPESESVEEVEDSLFTLPAFEVPNVEEILKNEELETLKLIETLQADIEREKMLWGERLKELPGKAQFEKYKKRIEQLQSSSKKGLGGILGSVEEVQSIKKEIEQDLERMKIARKEFEEKIELLETRLAQAKAAPKNDMRRLQEKYSLSPKGLANMSQALLGSHIGSWVHDAAYWYERVKPYLETVSTEGGKEELAETQQSVRGQGVDVRFAEYQPLPDLLIRLANVSLNLDVGVIGGKVKNITADQDILGQPLTFAFSGEKLKDLHAMSLQGTLNHINPPKTIDQARFHAQGYHLQGVTLSRQTDWPVSIDDGLADIKVDTTLRGEALAAKGTSRLTSLLVSAGIPNDSNPLTQSLSSAVSGISNLSVQADVTGTLQKYDIALSSDLDRILQEAAGKMVQDLAGSFGKELQSAISAKTAGPLKELTGSFGGFNAIGGDLVNRLAQEKDLLKGLLEKGLLKKSLPGGLKLPF